MNIIEIKDLSFSYEKTEVLSNINFNIKENEFICLMGNNGSGKSTLLKILIGELKNYTGSIKIFNKELNTFNEWSKIGYVPQVDRNNITNFPISVREMILLNFYYDFNLFNLPKKRHLKLVEEVLHSFKIEHLADKNFNELSGGQKQRVMIAKAMVHSPELLIFDEPTVGVDAESKKVFYELIDHLHKFHNITIILVTHELDFSDKLIDRKLILKEKEIKEYV
ncbi:metal ABC transporter ATP-binding protein [Helcococcus ovis]|uniref:Metal ABC transporter ATP-binding protein n=1 Tax=Helcococcus ovis TaxID=72026 RepID=A0A4R9C3Z6_9FIRM|nr:metal ABC transporter ATP-binding protein [Helcococcus ovis]TFF64863.1 metal ABC transporter ATP-binding protein [Helcococcus ovis]TFF67140.1 metal ABC transporter ATP-binding protein [Helcococcus ovis]TFF67965.1 metal ABC transporter ATP-binding protein [Helcococcus ovis]WNZ01920.1 metal ABC transporter ATP-binding protein [Helcococcus ovis]